ncbi:hypothetical protein Pla108_14110 [Botrimarina colliarenosi]|uniref:Uncharacterized protein n=1 Tax=Botrimarina colliarenosi TaxID=2528001 RepID=A0A5C6ALE0_9BACT|nr:hypothetical protein Pla108_14110 [Botrimarina colliarenosi]
MPASQPAAPPRILIRLRPRVTCPHCWQGFGSEDIRWVATHPDLQNDARLGDEGLRFLPTRFNVQGNAVDSRGMICHEVACPNCHLRVPRPLVEVPPLFASIAGTPSCGKTYFLASMAWRLRNVLPGSFGVSFTDADPISNLPLNEYENLQFYNPDPDAYVKLAKTQTEGDLYNLVRYGEQIVRYPRPFLFSVRPAKEHPLFAKTSSASRLLCLYDNAGESFQPGSENAAAPVTRHLAQAQFLMFCFDPTQEPRLRRDCAERSGRSETDIGLETYRQDSVFHEMVARVRQHGALHQNQKHSRPLIIVVTKFDTWSPLLGMGERLPDPWRQKDGGLCGLDHALIDEVSNRVRDLLRKYSPSMVSAAESFTDHVVYVPVSATGCLPVVDSDTGQSLGVSPKDIDPIWAETPMLVALARWGGGLVLPADVA